MPIFDYKCTNPTCGQVQEVIQKFVDADPDRKCPVCNSPMEKQIGASSFQLKGNGWYATDFKTK